MESILLRKLRFVSFLSGFLTIASAQSIGGTDPGYSNATVNVFPSLIETTFLVPGIADKPIHQYGTCFAINRIQDSLQNFALYLTCLHLFEYRDTTTEKLLASIDTARIFINGVDTVVVVRAKLSNRHPSLDLALLTLVGDIPNGLEAINRVVVFSPQQHAPSLGEQIAYSGFPLILGYDQKFRLNSPVIVAGYVSQLRGGAADFMIQAPTFKGASGSPITSVTTQKLVGIVSAIVENKKVVPKQESFGIGVRGDSIVTWLSQILPLTGARNYKPVKK